MSAARETIMAALFAKLKAIPGLTTASRRNRAPEQIVPALSPALFLLEDGEDYAPRSAPLPPKRRLMPKVVFYNDIGTDLNAVPATAINQLLDALDAALSPNDPSNLFTLGGLVDSVVVQGEVKKAPGDVTGKSVAIVPLVITLP